MNNPLMKLTQCASGSLSVSDFASHKHTYVGCAHCFCCCCKREGERERQTDRERVFTLRVNILIMEPHYFHTERLYWWWRVEQSLLFTFWCLFHPAGSGLRSWVEECRNLKLSAANSSTKLSCKWSRSTHTQSCVVVQCVTVKRSYAYNCTLWSCRYLPRLKSVRQITIYHTRLQLVTTVPVWRGQKDECVECCCLFLHHTGRGVSGRKLQLAALNVECVSCVQSPRRSRATVICLCSVLMSCYISEQRWMQLIDCDAAINYSCNRSVLESDLGTDRRRWMFKGCRRPRVFFPRFHPNGSISFCLLHVHTLTPPPRPLCPSYLKPPRSILSFCPWTERLCPPPTSKGADQSAGCPFLLPPNRLDDVCFCPASWE